MLGLLLAVFGWLLYEAKNHQVRVTGSIDLDLISDGSDVSMDYKMHNSLKFIQSLRYRSEFEGPGLWHYYFTCPDFKCGYITLIFSIDGKQYERKLFIDQDVEPVTPPISKYDEKV